MDEVKLFPEWADELAIDTTGRIWAFEGGCFWDGKDWIPVDDFDGLRYELIARTHQDFTVEIAKTLKFVQERGYVIATESASTAGFALPVAK